MRYRIRSSNPWRAHELALPLSMLFNQSLVEGTFPSTWKDSFIVPVFKSGDRSECSNYRGIALLSAFPKIFESLVCDRLEDALGDVIHPAQHGFRQGHSTTTNLSLYVDFVTNTMARDPQVDSIYTDFSKAFDTVDHSLLLRKLEWHRVSGPRR